MKEKDIFNKTVFDLNTEMIKNSINTISDMENELSELKIKYDIAIKFIKRINTFSCELTNPCRACDASDTLRELGEK